MASFSEWEPGAVLTVWLCPWTCTAPWGLSARFQRYLQQTVISADPQSSTRTHYKADLMRMSSLSSIWVLHACINIFSVVNKDCNCLSLSALYVALPLLGLKRLFVVKSFTAWLTEGTREAGRMGLGWVQGERAVGRHAGGCLNGLGRSWKCVGEGLLKGDCERLWGTM